MTLPVTVGRRINSSLRHWPGQQASSVGFYLVDRGEHPRREPVRDRPDRELRRWAVHQADDAPTDDPLFENAVWDAIPGNHERDTLRAKARQQLGTVGSGNYYVNVFADETGTIWVGVHFGSRGFGHTVASGFMALAQNQPWGARGKEVEALLDRS